jgi:hypothetical protein
MPIKYRLTPSNQSKVLSYLFTLTHKVYERDFIKKENQRKQQSGGLHESAYKIFSGKIKSIIR